MKSRVVLAALWLLSTAVPAEAGSGAPAAALQFRQARAHSVAGRPQEALTAAIRAVELEPENVDYLRGAAQLATWVVRYDLARDYYRRLLAIRDDDSAALLGLARVESWSGELNEAVVHFRRYLERHPGDADARLEHARAEAWRGNYPVALKLLERYRELRGATVQYEDDRARFLLGAGRPNAALEILDPRLERDPESFELNADYTLALAASGRPGHALESLDHLGSLAADHPRLDEVQRVVATPMRSEVAPEVDVYSDSDGVERSQLGASGGVSLSPRTRLDAGAYSGELDADAGSGLEPLTGPTRLAYSGYWLGLEQRLGPRAYLEARVGSAEADGGEDLLTYRVAASFELSDAFDLDLERRRGFYLVSPRALDLGIADTTDRLAVSWRPNLRYYLDASAAYHSLSDGNARWQLTFEPRRSVLRREHFNLDLGLRAWWFGFDEDLGNGYYDPSSYRSYSVTSFSYWKFSDGSGLSLVLNLGVFKDDTMDDYELGGDANLELTLGVYRDWMLKLRGGVTENSRLGSGAFNAWGGGVVLTRRFAGPG